MKKKSRKITFECPNNLADRFTERMGSEGKTMTRLVVEALEKAENIVAEYAPQRTSGRPFKKKRARKVIKPEKMP